MTPRGRRILYCLDGTLGYETELWYEKFGYRNGIWIGRIREHANAPWSTCISSKYDGVMESLHEWRAIERGAVSEH